MAISTYTELQTAITNWMGRSDLSSRIPEFIALGESRLNKKLRLLQMEQTGSHSLTSGNSSLSLPTGFLEHIDMYYDTDNHHPVQYSQGELNKRKTTATGRPEYFSISDSIYFERSSDSTYALTQRFYKRWDIISDETNWLLTNAPDAYLYASLLEGAAFTRNSNNIPVWAQAYDRAVADLNRLDSRSRKNAVSGVDRALVRSRGFNITTGY